MKICRINRILYLLELIIVLVLMNCSGPRYLELATSGETAFNEGDYSKALENSELVISDMNRKRKTADVRIYAVAGNSAYALEQFDKSRKYLEKARQLDYSDELMYLNLAGIYQRTDNLSKEIDILEAYILKYPEGKEINPVRERLYRTCLESKNYKLADSLWTLLDTDSRKDISNLEVFLILNQEQGNNEKCDSAALIILDQDGTHEPALKWYAEKYYWKAENRYQEEMDAYENNNTRSQYNKLLKELKLATEDFKISLKYFENLYDLHPKPEYARYIGNIYARFGDEEKANYYHSRY